jgi:hypothetical protein
MRARAEAHAAAALADTLGYFIGSCVSCCGIYKKKVLYGRFFGFSDICFWIFGFFFVKNSYTELPGFLQNTKTTRG